MSFFSNAIPKLNQIKTKDIQMPYPKSVYSENMQSAAKNQEKICIYQCFFFNTRKNKLIQNMKNIIQILRDLLIKIIVPQPRAIILLLFKHDTILPHTVPEPICATI